MIRFLIRLLPFLLTLTSPLIAQPDRAKPGEQGFAWLREGYILYQEDAMVDALDAYQKARRLFEEVDHDLGQGTALLGESAVLFRLGRNEEALKANRRAQLYFEGIGSRLSLCDALMLEANILFRSGANQEALETHRKSRPFCEVVGNRAGMGNAWLGEGDVLFRLGDNDGALSAFRTARRHAKAAGDQLGQGNSWRGEAMVLRRSRDFDGALSAFRRARRLFDAVQNRVSQGNALDGEADILYLRGDAAEALVVFRRARELFEAAGDQLGQGNAWRGEADILRLWGDNDGALAAFQQARQLFETAGDQQGQGHTWRGEAAVFLRLCDYDRALSALRRARQHFENIGDQQGLAHTLDDEAEALLRLGDTKEALSRVRNARKLFEAIGDKLGQGSAWSQEAEILLKAGKASKAEAAAGRAVDLTAGTGVEWNQSRSLMTQAQAQRDLGNLAEAVQLAAKAIDLFDSVRGTYLTDVHRTDREFDVTGAYELLISSLWQLGRRDQVLERAEQARSRVLLDLISTGQAERTHEALASLDRPNQREAVITELAAIERELAQAPSNDKRRDLRQRRIALDEKMEKLRFESLLSTKKTLPLAAPLNLEGIHSSVAEVGPILLYHVTEEETFAFLLQTGHDPLSKVLPLSRKSLLEHARKLSESLANPAYERQASSRLRKLWMDLLAPFADDLVHSGSLVIVPHGPLHQIPFEALLDPGNESSFEHFDLSVVPSISTLRHVRNHHRTAQPEDGFVAFVSGGGVMLPAAEVAPIAGTFDPSRGVNFELIRVSYTSYERLAPRTRHLLIASQGAHTPGSRTLTYLEIEPTDRHDSRLTAAEIASLPINAELVTLAACNTAYAEALLSDERLDLVRAFLVAGAAAVLATRWKVPEDYRTSQFLVDFYRAYRQGGPDGQGMRKDQALTEARRRSRERGDPARVWAAWVLVGDAR